MNTLKFPVVPECFNRGPKTWIPAFAGMTVLLGALFFPASAQAAEEPRVSVKAEVNRSVITIGDPVEYTITVRHDPAVQILSPVPPPPADILNIKKVEDIHRREGSMTVEGRKFTLTAFQLGEFVLDPVKIQYRSGGKDPQTLETDKIYLTVKSVAAGEPKTDIRGVKSVIALARKFLSLLLILLAAVLGVAGFMGYRAFRKPAGTGTVLETAMSPEDEALSHLNQLFDSDWLRRGKFKEYYLRLSEIMRAYLEKRFQILAAEATTTEILRSLKQKEIDPALREQAAEVLEACDLAKFAKWKPDPPQIIQINQKSKQFVELARPQEVRGGV